MRSFPFYPFHASLSLSLSIHHSDTLCVLYMYKHFSVSLWPIVIESPVNVIPIVDVHFRLCIGMQIIV